MTKLIALLTDFGTSDIYVGVMKGVMQSICPDATFIDISHEVARQSIHNGAMMLKNSYHYFPKDTVFLVVVDPTVGSKRKPMIVKTDDYTFIAPDNGVLTPTLDELGNWQAYTLGNPDYQLTDGSFTFHGRDIFSPAAAYTANGIKITSFGGKITELVRLSMPEMIIKNNQIHGEVTHIDTFGNTITNIGQFIWNDNQLQLKTGDKLLPIDANKASVTVGNTTLDGIKQAYYEVGVGELILQVDSNGYLEIAINQGSASQHLDLEIRDTITLILE